MIFKIFNVKVNKFIIDNNLLLNNNIEIILIHKLCTLI